MDKGNVSGQVALVAKLFGVVVWIFRRLADAAMIEKASSEVRGTLCKLRRSSIMPQEADP